MPIPMGVAPIGLRSLLVEIKKGTCSWEGQRVRGELESGSSGRYDQNTYINAGNFQRIS